MKGPRLIEDTSHHGAFLGIQIAALCAALVLFGCQVSNQDGQVKSAQATPTINPIFLPLPTSTSPAPTPELLTSTPKAVTPTTALVDQETQAATLTPEVIPTETAIPSPTPTPIALTEVPIYKDQTDPNWKLRSSGMDVQYTAQDSAQVHDGRYAISILFRKDNSFFDFIVRQGSAMRYLRDNIYGIRFWIFSSDRPLAIDDIGIGIYGSQKLPYMLLKDASIDQTVFDPIFNKENKYLLGLNRAVPINTWVEVEIPMDSLQYDTNYQYITGIRFRNNASFQGKIIIDNLVLLQYPSVP